MLFKISHSVCPCISFQTLTHTEEPFLRYSITLTVTIFWAGCKKKSAELLHHLLMVHVHTKWTLISQFPGQSLDPIPLDRVFLAAEVNHSPRHQCPPPSCRAETWGCRGLASRTTARKSKPIELQLLKKPHIFQERTVCGNGGCFGKWWPVIKPKSCCLFNWFVAHGTALSRTAHCQPQTIVKYISCDAVVCILNLALAFVPCSKASLC